MCPSSDPQAPNIPPLDQRQQMQPRERLAVPVQIREQQETLFVAIFHWLRGG